MYSEAILCKIAPGKKSVLYCNRALAQLKLENYAIALFDACESVKLDGTNIKGFYRRAQAYAALRQLKNAVADFKTVCKMRPQNKDAREKYEITQKEHRLQQIALAISSDEQKIQAKPDDIFVESSYCGPKLESIEDITPEWITSVMDWQKDSKKLHKRYVTMIIAKATEVLECEKTLQHITIDELEEITVCGDTHG